MSRDLLEKILKSEFDLNLNELIDFLLLFKKNDYIYPSTIKNKFNNKELGIFIILYTLFFFFLAEKIVKMYYEIYCYTCNKPIKIYEKFGQIDNSIICNYCENNILNENSIKVVYKVVK